MGGTGEHNGVGCAPVSIFFAYMVKRKRKRARGRRGGCPHRRSAQVAARRWARARERVCGVRSRRLAWRPVPRVVLGTPPPVVFRATVRGMGGTSPPAGGGGRPSRPPLGQPRAGHAARHPEVKVPGQRHLCRHRSRMPVEGEGGGVLYLFLSSHHREGGVSLPYIWLQGAPAVWRVAGFFRL